MNPLIQEWYVYDRSLPRENGAWRAIVACILLNQTQGQAQVAPMIDDLFAQSPEPMDMLMHTYTQDGEMERILRPLGLQNRRRRLLRNFCRGWLYLDGHRDVSPGSEVDLAMQECGLAGVGEYARDCWNLLVQGRYVRPQDKELARLIDECAAQQGWSNIVSVPDQYLQDALAWRAREMFEG